jgi:tRNA pseudouridine55 synthase
MGGGALAELTGVLPVDKPEGPTSHDMVAAARRALKERRIGHTGTLDPFASGLLLLCIGPATRLAEYLTPLPKTYRAVMRLGETTDTDDLAGEILDRSDAWRSLEESHIHAALQKQTGRIQQLPPIYSAKKVDGVRMYAAARRGEVIERKPVEVTVHRISLLGVALPEVEFEVECSSGTYIRAIARDVGEALGVGGHLRSLRRTASGRFLVEQAITLENLTDEEQVRGSLVSPAAAVAHLPQVILAEEQRLAIAQGRSVPAPRELRASDTVALCTSDGELAAIGEARGEVIQPRKVFV